MIIFDYGNQNLINYPLIIVGILLFSFGLYIFFESFKIKPEIREDFMTRFFDYSPERLAERANFMLLFVKILGIAFVTISICIFYVQLEPYIYSKNVKYFETINTLSTRIDSVETNKLFETNTITLYVKNKSFSIVKDRRYVGNRNLMNNDSIRIEYFETESKIGHMKAKYIEVTRIELK